MSRGDLVATYAFATFVVAIGVVLWGYRADRKGVPFPWDRYWHWWRVCIAYGMLAAVGLVPFAWLIYGGRPPRWVFYALDGLLPLLVLAIGFGHWRQWFPILGVGRPFLGSYMPRQEYIQQSLRTFGCSFGLGLVGFVVVFFLGRVVSG
jgi:hypothetical protein